ncbi:MAG: vWA domain-containing protein, partial [Polyangiales bacterium]
MSQVWIARAAWASLLLVACGDAETPAPHAPVPTRDPVEVAEPDAGGVDREAASDPSRGLPDAPAACAQLAVSGARVVPTVWLLIDGSGSMVAGFDGLVGSSRWTVLRNALLADGTGLVSRLGGSVAFGMMIYDGGLSPPGIKTDLCPGVVVVPPARDNHAALRAAYPELPLGASTPTHHALQELARRIEALPPAGDGPTYVVLATDGMPNLCDFHDGLPPTPDTERLAIETVGALANDGVHSFTISLAGSDPFLGAHLDAVARAGGISQSAFKPSNEQALVDALSSIAGQALPCTLKLEGKVAPQQACVGVVSLDGKPLACDAPDGYSLH